VLVSNSRFTLGCCQLWCHAEVHVNYTTLITDFHGARSNCVCVTDVCVCVPSKLCSHKIAFLHMQVQK